MSHQNFVLALVLLVSSFNNFIQAGVIRGVDIKPLKVAHTTGKWYLMASSDSGYQDICMINNVELLSENHMRMSIRSTLNPDSSEHNLVIPRNNEDLAGKIYNLTIDCIVDGNSMRADLLKDTHNVMSRNDDTHEVVTVISYDEDDNSYLILFVASRAAQFINGSDKSVFVFGKNKSLSDEFVNRVERGNFYQQAIKPLLNLYCIDPTPCE